LTQLLKLTDDNYFSLEADQQYMSVSQYKTFLKCETAALAQIQGKYIRPKSDALLFGSYVHAWQDGTVDKFKEQNPDLFSSKGPTKGQLKATYQNADAMIKVLEEDPFCMMALQGEKEIILTGELFGAPWKIKIDAYNPKYGRFADLKTVKAIREKVWNDELGYCSFVEAYGYITQMAIYSEIERQNRGGEDWLESYIVAVSKETPPDKAVITIDQETLQYELENIESKMERIILLKGGDTEPKRCEKCDYCRRTKKVTNVIHYLELIG
jgi:hypothetical protein